jgi:hypothetical protein
MLSTSLPHRYRSMILMRFDPEQMFVVQLSDFQWQTVHPTAEAVATKTR